MRKILILFVMLGLSINVFGGERKLKHRVSVGQIGSRSFPVPGGEEFDFGYVLNQMVMVNLANDPNFLATYAVESPEAWESFSNEPAISVVPDSDMYGKIVPDCLIDRNQMEIRGDVLSFELESGNSISIGYRKGETLNDGWGIGAKMSVKKSNLHVAFKAVRSVDFVNATLLGADIGDHTAKYRTNEVTVDFSGFTVSAANFFQSDLVKLTKKATDEALAGVASQIQDKIDREEYEWQTNVVKVGDPLIHIRAGSLDGVKVGDKFLVTNMRHEWTGEVCNSEYWPTPVRSAMVVKVRKVTELFSIVEPFSAPDGSPIHDVHVGDKVTIHKLK